MDEPKSSSSDTNQQGNSDDSLNQSFDDKQPETYVMPNGEPTSIAPIATPLSLQKPKGHSGRWLFRGFVVILIAVLGALVYWQYSEAQSASNERAALKTELETVKSTNRSANRMMDQSTLEQSKGVSPQAVIGKEVMNYVKANTVLSKAGQSYIEKIKYMTDSFARVDVLKVDPNDKTKQTLAATYFLKNVAESTADKNSEEGQKWTLIWTDDLTDANKKYLKETFGVTDDVFTSIREV